MAKFFNKITLPTALDKRTTFDLSSDHVTTMDFFKPKVTYFKEVVPGETVNLNLESFTRLSPLTVPSFGRIQMTHRAFFVPMRTLWQDWNNFITNTVVEKRGKLMSSVPCFNNKELVTLLTTGKGLVSENLFMRPVDSGQAFDVRVTKEDGSRQYYTFTALGRRVVDQLSCLGYKINWDQSLGDIYQSLLPLLSYGKVVNDWYYRNQYSTLSYYSIVDKMVQDSDSWHIRLIGTQPIEFAWSDYLQYIVGFAGHYEQDYFTSAWSNPSGPSDIQATEQGTYLPNVDDAEIKKALGGAGADGVQVDGNIANVRPSEFGTNSRITQFTIDALKSLSDYLKRHQLAGTQALDRYLARFGVNLTSEKLNRSNYLGGSTLPIKIGDIMSNADTEGAVLGSYAGTGVGYDNNAHFNLSTDEYGYIMVVTQIIPKVGYVQGLDRHVMHINIDEFYTPEFDGLGSQAIAVAELGVPSDSASDWFDENPFKIFGYSPRYAEYKVGKDRLTGDYQFKSRNTGEDSWYTFRMFGLDNAYADSPYASLKFLDTRSDGSQYNRIFNVQDAADADHFRCIFHFDVKSTAPMSSLYDNYEFEDKGREITMQINGTNLNGTN